MQAQNMLTHHSNYFKARQIFLVHVQYPKDVFNIADPTSVQDPCAP